MKTNLVALIILDGLGIREFEHGNAVAQANTPNIDRWLRNYERSILDASGLAVGLPAGQMGNSEVGHLNIGAGRVIYQDIVRIDRAIEDGSFNDMADLNAALDSLEATGNNLHIVGLLGSGGVHSHIRHQKAAIALANARGVTPILHVITDGRDTPQQSGIGFLAELEAFIADGHSAEISSVSGRYYAMDRDNRAERTKLAYDAITRVSGESAASAQAAIEGSYSAETTDEFILPTIIDGDIPQLADGDVMLFFNFRADRMRQIVRSFFTESFDEFERSHHPSNLRIFTMTPYDADFPVEVLFKKENVREPLAEVISKAGLKQFHAAETEKYPHVTYFFNGGREEPHEGETHHVTPSPKVATYDLQPEMSADELTNKVLERLESENDAFLLLNYANPDMVGHTGSLEAAVKAVETVDTYAAQVVQAVLDKGGVAFVTADHGNCEIMVDETTTKPHTYHTTNPVSFIAIANTYLPIDPRGKLADIAPTVLKLLGVEASELMTGKALV